MARNIALAALALMGAASLIVPTLQGVPTADRVVVGIFGTALIAISLIGALRWKPLLRTMARVARRSGETPVLGFMQAEFDRPSTGKTFAGKGWILIRGAELLVHTQSTVLASGEVRAIELAEIEGISLRTADSMAFNRLALTLTSGEEATFAVIPSNGSGLRGATESEVQRAIDCIADAMSSAV
ncbi:hypothetical protein MRBLWH13_003321 [Microbacterium sp. LWH13-1.2]